MAHSALIGQLDLSLRGGPTLRARDRSKDFSLALTVLPKLHATHTL